MLVAVALADRMARVAWSLMAKGGVYRDAGGGGLGRVRRVDVGDVSRAEDA